MGRENVCKTHFLFSLSLFFLFLSFLPISSHFPTDTAGAYLLHIERSVFSSVAYHSQRKKKFFHFLQANISRRSHLRPHNGECDMTPRARLVCQLCLQKKKKKTDLWGAGSFHGLAITDIYTFFSVQNVWTRKTHEWE